MIGGRKGWFLPGARVTCGMLFITRGQSPFLTGLLAWSNFREACSASLFMRSGRLLERREDIMPTGSTAAGRDSVRRRGRLEHGTPNPRDAVSDGLRHVVRNPIQSPRFRFLHGYKLISRLPNTARN